MAENYSVEINSAADTPAPTLEEEAAKYPDPVDPDRPEWLPEKFASVEDMAKAYGELEKKMGSRTETAIPTEEGVDEADEEADEAPEGEDEGEVSQEEAEDLARKASETAGLDFDDLSRQYWENGELGSDAYEALEKSGIPKHVVDAFIAGQEALLDRTRGEVFNDVGGEPAYQGMVEWAADNLSRDEIDAFNKAVNSGDLNTTKMAVRGLKARFDAAEGFEPKRTVQSATAKSTPQTYRSIAEMQKDMSDPRYQSDPAFRKDVERKLANSDIF